LLKEEPEHIENFVADRYAAQIGFVDGRQFLTKPDAEAYLPWPVLPLKRSSVSP
jgi:hypothetical protein